MTTIRLASIYGLVPTLFLMTPTAVFAATDGAAQNIGFPQLNPSSYASQLFWLAIAFVALYLLMSRIALPRIAEVLDLRHKQREGNLSRAEELQAETTKVKHAYEEALAQAQDDAQKRLAAAEQDIADMLSRENAKFTEEARKRVAQSDEAISKAKAEALAKLPEVAADIAADIVGKVAAINVSKADAQKVVQSVATQKEG